MWVRRAAIRPIPPFARVSAHILERIEQLLSEEKPESEALLEQAFLRFEQTQDALASRIAQALGQPMDETALALGYFLSLAVWLAFEESFGSRLGQVSHEDLEATGQSIDLDEELRRNAPDEAVDTDDVVAMEQPDIVEFIREHIDVALEAHAKSVELDDIDTIYRLMLVEVVALSYAVHPPDRHSAARAEWMA